MEVSEGNHGLCQNEAQPVATSDGSEPKASDKGGDVGVQVPEQQGQEMPRGDRVEGQGC